MKAVRTEKLGRWLKRTRHVCAGGTIPAEVDQRRLRLRVRRRLQASLPEREFLKQYQAFLRERIGIVLEVQP